MKKVRQRIYGEKVSLAHSFGALVMKQCWWGCHGEQQMTMAGCSRLEARVTGIVVSHKAPVNYIFPTATNLLKVYTTSTFAHLQEGVPYWWTFWVTHPQSNNNIDDSLPSVGIRACVTEERGSIDAARYLPCVYAHPHTHLPLLVSHSGPPVSRLEWRQQLKSGLRNLMNFSEEEIQMTKKHLDKCLPFLAIRQKRIESALRPHRSPVRMAKSKQRQQMLARMWGRRTLTVGGRQKWWTTADISVTALSSYTQPYHFWAYTKDSTSYYGDICSSMSIVASATISVTWKQPQCLPTDEWIMKTWYLDLKLNFI